MKDSWLTVVLAVCFAICIIEDSSLNNQLAALKKTTTESSATVEIHTVILNKHNDEIATLGKLSSQQSGLMKQMNNNLVGEIANVDKLVDSLKQRYFPPVDSMPFTTNFNNFTNYILVPQAQIAPVNK